MKNKNRYEMLKEVQKWDFAALEAALFLDNNPADNVAIEWFHHFQSFAEKAREEFENLCGPLQYQEQRCSDFWEWAKDPWPWEVEF
jgi:spore coat protein JB